MAVRARLTFNLRCEEHHQNSRRGSSLLARQLLGHAAAAIESDALVFNAHRLEHLSLSLLAAREIQSQSRGGNNALSSAIDSL
jgi:hypothetical protein